MLLRNLPGDSKRNYSMYLSCIRRSTHDVHRLTLGDRQLSDFRATQRHRPQPPQCNECIMREIGESNVN